MVNERRIWRIGGVVFLVALFLSICAWLNLDRPPKDIVFTTGTMEKMQANLWSGIAKELSMTDIFFLYFEGTEVEVKPSAYFHVSQEFVHYDYSRPARMTIMVDLQMTPTTIGLLPESLSAQPQQLVFSSSKPVTFRLGSPFRLGSHNNLSLLLNKTETYTELVFVLENFPEVDRLIRVEPTQVPQDLSISIDGRKPFVVELSDIVPGEGLTIFLGGNRDSLTQSDAVPWVGLSVISLDTLSVSFQQGRRLSTGQFTFFPIEGQLAIGDKPLVPIKRSFLVIDFSDKVGFTISDSSIVLSGKAKVIASSTSQQMLPSRWSDLPQIGQILIGVLAPLLVLVYGYLLRPLQRDR